MINPNSYTSPDHRPPRIFAQAPSLPYRNQSGQNLPIYPRHTIPNIPTSRTSFNTNLQLRQPPLTTTQQLQNGYPPTYYQPTRTTQPQHYLPSPKNLNTSSNKFSSSKYNFLHSSNTSRGYLPDKKQKSATNLSFQKQPSQLYLDPKQINQKIDLLLRAIKSNQKRINQLQKYQLLTNTSSSSNHTKISEHQDLPATSTIRSIDKQQNMKKLKDEISLVRQQIKNYLTTNDVTKIVNEKVKQFINKTNRQLPEISTMNQLNHYEQMEQIYKQLQLLRNQFDQKIRKNFDTFASIVAKIQKQMHNINTSSVNSVPKYSSSGIKCTGTAILLRFVESFKVKKNNAGHSGGSKSGEIKIILMDNTYYIDNQGYLLDKDQCYLVDYRGVQVKLEDKHLKMLKEENVVI